MLVKTVWSLAGEFVKPEFLLVVVRFCLLAGVGAAAGTLLRRPWASPSEFQMHLKEDGVNEPYSWSQND